MKAMSIVGILLAAGFLAWFYMFVSSDGGISKEEFAPVGFGFGIWALVFALVAMSKSGKK